MEYVRNICISQQEFHELLMSSHDYDTYFKLSTFLGGLFCVSLVIASNIILNKQREIEGLLGVKASLMEHIMSLEDELTQKYADEVEEAEEEAVGEAVEEAVGEVEALLKSDEIDEGAEAGDELDELHED